MTTYRVIFRKNLGHGKRTRIVFTAENLTELSELITAKAKEDRLRPMRVQAMDGNTISRKYRIKLIEGEYDISIAKERNISNITEDVNNDTAKINEANAAGDLVTADLDDDDGMSFDVD